MGEGILYNPEKIKEIYELANTYIDTDVSLSEIISLGKVAKHMTQDSVLSHTLTDGYDGFLYSPDMSLTNGRYVLKPIGNDYDDIHQFVSIIFGNPLVFQEEAKIELLNGTSSAGLAGSCKEVFNKYGIDVYKIGNTEKKLEYNETWIHDHSAHEFPNTMAILPQMVGGIEVQGTYQVKPTKADITVILGKDQACVDVFLDN
ncbi:MAG: LytR C-terminal domain-containing protein [Patescibacteria group bacterium]|nr:LytR C-terminal domain-containing protein [Patescibacteria group bacterium]